MSACAWPASLSRDPISSSRDPRGRDPQRSAARRRGSRLTGGKEPPVYLLFRGLSAKPLASVRDRRRRRGIPPPPRFENVSGRAPASAPGREVGGQAADLDLILACLHLAPSGAVDVTYRYGQLGDRERDANVPRRA